MRTLCECTPAREAKRWCAVGRSRAARLSVHRRRGRRPAHRAGFDLRKPPSRGVWCRGRLQLQGLAIESLDGWAVKCVKGRAELSGCTLTSPKYVGLGVANGATATMDGGAISGCGTNGVYCYGSGSTATVRPPAAAPSAAPPCPLRAAGAAAFLGPVSPFFPPFFGPP
eukprot:COSAG04_NODE_8287_length_995_cov_94.277902_2_plen_169_part_00